MMIKSKQGTNDQLFPCECCIAAAIAANHSQLGNRLHRPLITPLILTSNLFGYLPTHTSGTLKCQQRTEVSHPNRFPKVGIVRLIAKRGCEEI